MSRENLELITRLYDEFLARPEQVSDPGLLQFFDPAVEIRQSASMLGSEGTFHGYDGVARSGREVFETFRDAHWIPVRLVDGGDHVVATVEFHAHGRQSGVEVNERVAHVWTIRGGQVVTWQVYMDSAHALEAAGLYEQDEAAGRSEQAMSQANVDIVRGVQAEFEQGNFWIPETFDPSVRVVWLPVAGGEAETVGLDDMARAMKAWIESWEQVTNVAERIIDAGDRGVVVIAEWRGRGRASGVFTKWRYGAVWTLRDGKVTSIISYPDPADALEAAGLSQQDAHAGSEAAGGIDDMTQENVDIVRAGTAAWSRGDWDGLRDTYDPDVVMRTVAEWPEAGPHFGRDAVVRFFQQLRATWDTNELETVSLTEAGDRVVGHYVLHGVGRGPDARIEVANVFTFRRGRVVMVEYFWNHAEALEAIGLSSKTLEPAPELPL
jgi:ketosteroid isomerase-like protein